MLIHKAKHSWLLVCLSSYLLQASLVVAAEGNQRLSFSFNDVLVRDALQQLARFDENNLIVSDSVTGSITIELTEVTPEQAVDAILELKGLGKKVDGNILLIAPNVELEALSKRKIEQKNSLNQLVELEQQAIKIHYADIAALLKQTDGDSRHRILSERGSVTVDERTNTLLIKDLPANIAAFRQWLALIDVPVKQVQIEARIVSIKQGYLEELGARWGTDLTDGSSNLATSNSGSLNGIDQTEPLDRSPSLHVNFAATSTSSARLAFKVAKLSGDLFLDLELSALQAELKAEVISSPRIVTTNNSPAYIEQGTEIPYQEATSSGATSVSFKKAVLSLTVTPQITEGNGLILDLLISQDSPGEVVKTGVGEALAIDTQRLETQVWLKNEETIVLGGVFQHSMLSMVDKVPLLGDIPVLGHLFKRQSEKVDKRELLIFVTPKVIFP